MLRLNEKGYQECGSDTVFFIVLSLILPCGCTSQSNKDIDVQPTIEFLSTAPAPRPDFVAVLHPKPNDVVDSGQIVAVLLNEKALWETGNTKAESHEHIRRNTWLTIDGRRIPFEINEIMEPSQSGFFTIQFEFVPDKSVPNIVSGAHLIGIHTTSMSGKNYDYSWVLTISDTPPK